MEWFITDDGKYRIESLSATTFPGALRVLREALCRDEHVSIALGVSQNPKAVEELLELGADAALDGVSLVSIAVDTGEVVAAVFNKIQLQTSDISEKSFFETFAEERCTQAASRLYVQFMDDIDQRCNFFTKFGIDCSFEVMFLATLREHRKQNLALLLCKYSRDIAKKMRDGPIAPIEVKDLGPKYSHLQPRKLIETYPKICHAIMTAEASRRIGKELNLTVHLALPFSEFVFDGKTFSERIGDESAYFEVGVLLL